MFSREVIDNISELLPVITKAFLALSVTLVVLLLAYKGLAIPDILSMVLGAIFGTYFSEGKEFLQNRKLSSQVQELSEQVRSINKN